MCKSNYPRISRPHSSSHGICQGLLSCLYRERLPCTDIINLRNKFAKRFWFIERAHFYYETRFFKSPVIVYRRTWHRAKYDLKREQGLLMCVDTRGDTGAPLLRVITAVFSAYVSFPRKYEIKDGISFDTRSFILG